MASYFRHNRIALFLLPFLASVVILALPKTALAATGSWVDVAHIKVGTDIYYDRDPYDNNLNFRLNGDQGSCVSEISGFGTSDIFDQSRLDQADLIIKSTATGGACLSSPVDPLTLSSVTNASIIFNWVDAAQIQGVVSARVWTRDTTAGGANEVFKLNGSNGTDCDSLVEIVSSTTGRYVNATSSSGSSCTDSDFSIGNPSNRSLPAGTGAINNNTSGGTAAPIVPENCETAEVSGGEKLRWLLCAGIEGLDKAIDRLDDEIQGVLLVNDPANTSFGANEEMYNAWGRLRNIALIILIPMMLVMVIGTAMGVSFLDAYTVRRAMPRFLVAIFFISTSWYFTSFLINLTNTVGTGILGLMTQPFGGPSNSLSDLLTPTGAANSFWGGLAIFGGVILAGVATLGIVLSYALVGAAVLFIGWLLLVLRQLLILALVLFAPLAILSWVFPNNDALWKLWWGTFSKLLLMFPLIMALMGAGKIFAYVVAAAR